MSHRVTVHQLHGESRQSGAFMNVLNGYDFVGVWSMFTDDAPVAYLQKDYRVCIMSFGSQEAFDSWTAGEQLRDWQLSLVTKEGLVPYERSPVAEKAE